MHKLFFCLILSALLSGATAQTYTSFFTGDTADVAGDPMPGIVLAGGGGDSDGAMQWMLQRAGGGDVVVLRASSADGYNDYFYSDLGVSVNSVETIRFDDPAAASDPYVIQQIENAECLFIAGGDQWDYVSYWKDTPVQNAIQYLIDTKGVTIGGTSAGMAIQGQAYFSAENGTVYSEEALTDPYNMYMSIGYNEFLQHPILANTITDTHFDDPDRRGRLTGFLARLLTDNGIMPFGIACEEYVAVCIDEDGMARVFGEYPAFDDYAFFVQVNPCLDTVAPEVCEPGQNLHWQLGGDVLKVVKMAGDENGTMQFDLNDWKTVSGGSDYEWQDWYVSDGELLVMEDAAPVACDTVSTGIHSNPGLVVNVFPNPASDRLYITAVDGFVVEGVISAEGKKLTPASFTNGTSAVVDLEGLAPGLYFIVLVHAHDGNITRQPFVKQ
jgi:cyanophycinase-like exopeptidase